ncbi:MAG: 5'-methylthioadenosine/adenosylhomocysteine nucleosidase [Tissierellia bacterium]|nr:5'-methylthioadenosine/adenosylhomocysteine nucleosidase [Tissierellia bacterium]
MKIVILGAMEEETSTLLANLEDLQEEGRNLYPYHRGFFYDKEIFVIKTGIGKVNAALCTQRLIDLHRPDAVIMVGVAGAIEKLAIGDVVLATKVAHHDLKPEFLVNHQPYLDEDAQGYFSCDRELLQCAIQSVADLSLNFKVYTGPMASGENFVEKQGREEIIEKFAPLCVDMETAGMAHACHRSQIPFFALRSITDTEEESGLDHFEKNYEVARENAQYLLMEILKAL